MTASKLAGYFRRSPPGPYQSKQWDGVPAGARNVRTYAHPSAPRWALYEAGMARMGSDPKKSVLNQFQRTHDINNLYVMDASGFTSNPCQNPTLTIMSLCVRSCDFLMQELKKGA